MERINTKWLIKTARSYAHSQILTPDHEHEDTEVLMRDYLSETLTEKVRSGGFPGAHICVRKFSENGLEEATICLLDGNSAAAKSPSLVDAALALKNMVFSSGGIDRLRVLASDTDAWNHAWFTM